MTFDKIEEYEKKLAALLRYADAMSPEQLLLLELCRGVLLLKEKLLELEGRVMPPVAPEQLEVRIRGVEAILRVNKILGDIEDRLSKLEKLSK